MLTKQANHSWGACFATRTPPRGRGIKGERVQTHNSFSLRSRENVVIRALTRLKPCSGRSRTCRRTHFYSWCSHYTQTSTAQSGPTKPAQHNPAQPDQHSTIWPNQTSTAQSGPTKPTQHNQAQPNYTATNTKLHHLLERCH